MVKQVNGFFPGELYPDTTIGGCIDIFENAWPNYDLTIDAVENQAAVVGSGLNWERAGTLGRGINQNVRTNYHTGITDSAISGNIVGQQIHNQMYSLLLASTIPYAEKHDIHNLFHEPYNMLKYSFGQEYKAHADGETINGRTVSAIIYLNADYEGGEIEFVNFGVKIKPEPGMLILFPSNYAYSHIAHPVTAGTKYALVTWITDRIVQ